MLGQGKVISEDWRENHRMLKNSFYKLCDLLAQFISKNTTYMRQPISPETQVAVTLHYLSDAGRMRKTANSFGIGKGTVSRIVKNVTEMICQHLGPKLIKLPLSENEVKHLVYYFEKVHGFPQCLGVVDGPHKTPKNNSTDFMKEKVITQ